MENEEGLEIILRFIKSDLFLDLYWKDKIKDI